MSDQAFRFIHASDFRLDQPLRGLSEIPAQLRDLMIDAPYLAAERVFLAALQEQVALVVLSGNLLDTRAASARAMAFLRDQFERLQEQGICVYWSPAGTDSDVPGLNGVSMPDSVHCFDSGEVEAVCHGGEPESDIVVVGCRGRVQARIQIDEFRVETRGAFTIAAATGQAEPQVLSARHIDYWALGGRTDRRTLCTEPNVALYAGTPQGRSPRDVGPHGCTLVDIGTSKKVRLRFMPCDVVRWQHERVIVSADTGWDELTETLAERVAEMRSQATGHSLLVRWTLVAADPMTASTILRRTAARVDDWLRRQYGEESEPCWPVSVDVEAPDQITSASYDEDTLLGDYLRAVRQLAEDAEMPSIESWNTGTSGEADFAWVADLAGAESREKVLRQAAELGSALLRGEDIQ